MRYLSVISLVLLVACSNVRNTRLPKDLSSVDSIKPAIEKLKPEERELLAGYIMRHTMSSAFGSAFGVKADPIPDGMTIGKAIDEQRSFVEKKKLEEAAEKAAKEKAAGERKALAAQMAQVLASKLMEVSLHKATFRDFDVENYINFAFEFENKGLKTIVGLKGIATFKDKFGDTVSELPIKIEQELPAGKRILIKLSKRYNQFDSDDQKLAGLDATNANFELFPEVVLFSDGTKFESPKNDK